MDGKSVNHHMVSQYCVGNIILHTIIAKINYLLGLA